MSQGLNNTSIIGFLGKDPQTNDHGTVARFSVGVNEHWKDAEGNDREHTEWFRVVCFNGVAGAAAQYLSRGRQVYVDGRLRTRTYTDRNEEESRSLAQRLRGLNQLGGRYRPAAGRRNEITLVEELEHLLAHFGVLHQLPVQEFDDRKISGARQPGRQTNMTPIFVSVLQTARHCRRTPSITTSKFVGSP